jgi:hypothetical protein
MEHKTHADKGRYILNSKKIFPEFNIIDYDGSLKTNLVFYNENIDSSVKKAAAIEFWKKQGKDTAKISKLSEGWFITCGAVAHMAGRGIALDVKHLTYLDKKFNELCAMKQDEEDNTPPVVRTNEEKSDAVLSSHIAEFENGVDLIYTGKSFDAKGYLIRNEVKPTITKKIAEHFKSLLKELKDVETDEQLKESYNHLTKRELTKLREQIESMIASCEVACAITKAARKPRAKKVKAPSVVVKNIKYMKEDPALGLVSMPAEKLVDSSEVWIFNTKVRRLFRYSALQGSKISVKGTTLTGFDPEKSGGKKLRKPEVQLKDVSHMTSRPLTKLYNEIKAVASKATGRINEDCIILKIF